MTEQKHLGWWYNSSTKEWSKIWHTNSKDEWRSGWMPHNEPVEVVIIACLTTLADLVAQYPTQFWNVWNKMVKEAMK